MTNINKKIENDIENIREIQIIILSLDSEIPLFKRNYNKIYKQLINEVNEEFADKFSESLEAYTEIFHTMYYFISTFTERYNNGENLITGDEKEWLSNNYLNHKFN